MEKPKIKPTVVDQIRSAPVAVITVIALVMSLTLIRTEAKSARWQCM